MASRTSSPSTIKAWQYSGTTGGIEKNLTLNPSAPAPKAKPGEHLVQISVMALNPVDYKVVELPLAGRFLVSKPATPGVDYAGRVVTPAAGSSLQPGQLVFGCAGTSPFAGGALREVATSGHEGTVVIPEGLSLDHAASIGICGLTAYQAIQPFVKSGDKIFINGGSGGTGVFGIQIAKALGCHVTTTCSTPNVELCRSLGADEVVDYRKQDVLAALIATGRQFDHVVDNVGGNFELYFKSHRYTRPGAIYLTVGGEPSFGFIYNMFKVALLPGFLGGGRRKMTAISAKTRRAELEQIAAWMAEGKVKPVIDETFAFEDAPKAYAKSRTGRAKGKILVQVAPETAK